MKPRNFIIGSGYYDGPGSGSNWFYPIWKRNTMDAFKNTEIQNGIVVLSVGTSYPPDSTSDVHMIRLSGNLGHVANLVAGEKTHRLCGWSSAMITLAMMAYTNESDFIWKEQDCLAFGPWIEKLYEEIGAAGLIFGSCKLMPAAQSLFLVKHEYIPKFVRRYVSGHPERTEAWLPERKFWRMEKESPQQIKRFSFPFDRDRPLDITLPVWYAQKFKPEELKMLADAGLITIPKDTPEIPNLKVFSNAV